jgi:NAD+ synthase (glutamine-hydrolysing)
MAQINTTVGDLSGNTEKIICYIRQARDLGVNLVTFPELAITGYPPEDLLLKPQFIDGNLNCLQQVVDVCKGITAVIGFVDRREGIYNAAAVIYDRTLAGVYHKMHLPNYGVFDEYRYFRAGTTYPVFVSGEVVFGVNICEDIWYPGGPTTVQALNAGASVIINISSSPYHAGKRNFRERILATRAADNVAIVAYNNLVGGQDELVFDGGSMILDQRGELLIQGKQFEEDLIVADLDLQAVFRQRLHDPRRRQEKLSSEGKESVEKVKLPEVKFSQTKPALRARKITELQPSEEIYNALVLGTRDYVHKNDFEKVVVGLSGGIDSSLTSVIAVDALGKENVIGVTMPSQYSSTESTADAEQLARNFGIRLITVPIADIFSSSCRALKELFKGTETGVAEENLQARIRGNLLMAFSNKFGWLVLTTGNKSETSVGYCTLYGDMAGGLAVIKDIPKTLVYQLAKYRNAKQKMDLIPQRVLEKPPSAELKPDQKDTDTLPPYSTLDPILEAYVQEDRSSEEIVAMGFEKQLVERVVKMVDQNEYKRRQSPPGIKITPLAFGKDRRLPITNKYRELG